ADLEIASLEREGSAAGVMMLPIPSAGILEAVDGQQAARAVAGIIGLNITMPGGTPVVPLPEGDRYLGFLFASGEKPEDVEKALREAHALLDVRIAVSPIRSRRPVTVAAAAPPGTRIPRA
ncbi:MAG: hypothetical protein ABJC24_06710, partial [Chloroflexota bacterium]